MVTPDASMKVPAPTLIVTAWDSAYCPPRFTARWMVLQGAPELQGLASLPATDTVNATAACAGAAARPAPSEANSAVVDARASARAPRGRPGRCFRWVLVRLDMERPPRAS